VSNRFFDNRFLSTIGAGCILIAACALLLAARNDVRQVIRATIAGGDEVYNADVERISGKNRLLTTTTIASVNIPNGQDPLPDSYYTIVDTGASGGTWTTSVKGTLNDPSSPDRDVADVDVNVSVTVTEAGDELALRDKIVSAFNADAGAQAAYLKAYAIKDRAIVHVSSTKFSLPGEFYERSTALDFAVTTPVDGDVIVQYDKLESRAKPTSLGRDPNNGHNLGVQAISGSVQVSPAQLSDVFEEFAYNATHGNDLTQDGSSVEIEYFINCSNEKDKFFTELRTYLIGSSVKFGQYGSLSSKLTNGLYLELRSDGELANFSARAFKATEDFAISFAVPSNRFNIHRQPSLHLMIAAHEYPNPFVIRKCGTFTTDDYIKVIVRDDLTSLTSHEVSGRGFQKEP